MEKRLLGFSLSGVLLEGRSQIREDCVSLRRTWGVAFGYTDNQGSLNRGWRVLQRRQERFGNGVKKPKWSDDISES